MIHPATERSLRLRRAAVWVAGLVCLPALAQQFVVTPSASVLTGDPLHIALTGLTPGADVTVTATRSVRDFAGLRPYRAEARFVVGADGRVDLARQAPSAGSYSGADVRGLFWSMVPVMGAAAGATAQPEGQVVLTASAGERELARQAVELRHARADVVRQAVARFPGAAFASLPGTAKRPALIVLGGSEGGSMAARSAPAYASRGFAVLGLPYYSPPGWGASGPTPAELPQLPAAFKDIPLERLEEARAWLAEQPGVDATRIAVVGTSKGAEFALSAAARLPWIRAVVALVPTDVVWEGWGPGTAPGTNASFAWQGKPLDFVPYKNFQQEFAGFQTGAPVLIRRPHDAGRAAHPERVSAARIAVESIAAPVFVAGGDDDQVWDSGGMTRAIARARASARLSTVALTFVNAGHAIGGTGWAPTTLHNAGPMKMGGTPQADARAQVEIWSSKFEFLRIALGPVPD